MGIYLRLHRNRARRRYPELDKSISNQFTVSHSFSSTLSSGLYRSHPMWPHLSGFSPKIHAFLICTTHAHGHHAHLILLHWISLIRSIVCLKPDGTRAENRFRLSPKRTSPFNSSGESVQSTAGSRGVRISVSKAGYTTFRGRVRVLATNSIRQFPLHFPSRASPCAIRCQTSSTYNGSSTISPRCTRAMFLETATYSETT